MTTPINTFQDILDAMEQDPSLRDALRRHILTEELLQMPVRLERIEANIVALKTDVAVLKADMAEVKTNVAKLGGDVSNLRGTDYESHVAARRPPPPPEGPGHHGHRLLHPTATCLLSPPSWTRPRSAAS